MNYTLRYATAADGEKMFAQLPRLAAFNIPAQRKPEHLYSGDGKMLKEWIAGNEPDCFAYVAVNDHEEILGWAFVRMQPEFLSYAPGCHLEVILVNESAAGHGIGQKLLAASEAEAKNRGALSMTLHVFASNKKARALYEKSGFEGELLRYIKNFDV